MTDAYIFDIDGTIANNKHREHHIVNDHGKRDWPGWYGDLHKDTPFPHILKLINDLSGLGLNHIILVSGRGAEYRDATVDWLEAYDIPYDALYMRPIGDRRDDNIIKVELLREIQAQGYNVIMAFDDRNRVVKAWREAGIPCAQVAEGDF